jgi:hypothetical protein
LLGFSWLQKWLDESFLKMALDEREETQLPLRDGVRGKIAKTIMARCATQKGMKSRVRSSHFSGAFQKPA